MSTWSYIHEISKYIPTLTRGLVWCGCLSFSFLVSSLLTHKLFFLPQNNLLLAGFLIRNHITPYTLNLYRCYFSSFWTSLYLRKLFMPCYITLHVTFLPSSNNISIRVLLFSIEASQTHMFGRTFWQNLPLSHLWRPFSFLCMHSYHYQNPYSNSLFTVTGGTIDCQHDWKQQYIWQEYFRTLVEEYRYIISVKMEKDNSYFLV